MLAEQTQRGGLYFEVVSPSTLTYPTPWPPTCLKTSEPLVILCERRRPSFKEPSGVVSRVRVAEEALVFMIGQGAAQWLARQAMVIPAVTHPPLLVLSLVICIAFVFESVVVVLLSQYAQGKPRSLRAAPHAMVIPQGSASRLWYGKMYLPPPGLGLFAHEDSPLTATAPDDDSVIMQIDPLAAGCGSFNSQKDSPAFMSSRRSGDDCTEGQQGCMWCWMRWMKPANGAILPQPLSVIPHRRPRLSCLS